MGILLEMPPRTPPLRLVRVMPACLVNSRVLNPKARETAADLEPLSRDGMARARSASNLSDGLPQPAGTLR
jgi:hypothetical protein